MKKLLSILALLITFTAASQKNEVKVEVKETNGKLLFYCTNTTDTNQEVTLTLTKHKGLSGYSKPLKKTLVKKGKKLFLTTSIKGAYSYNYTVNNKPIAKAIAKIKSPKTNTKTVKKSEQLTIRNKEELLKKYPKINKGIVVFDKTDCPRCNFTTSYLLDNKVKFQHLNITDNVENRALMWVLLTKKGVKDNVRTPVILVNGKLTHSHKDIKDFVRKLKN